MSQDAAEHARRTIYTLGGDYVSMEERRSGAERRVKHHGPPYSPGEHRTTPDRRRLPVGEAREDERLLSMVLREMEEIRASDDLVASVTTATLDLWIAALRSRLSEPKGDVASQSGESSATNLLGADKTAEGIVRLATGTAPDKAGVPLAPPTTAAAKLRLADRLDEYAHELDEEPDTIAADLREAAAALRSDAREGSEQWREIETAPKDGKPVLLSSATAEMAVGFWHQATGDGITGWYIHGGVFNRAAHWMPLPAPPGTPPNAPEGSEPERLSARLAEIEVANSLCTEPSGPSAEAEGGEQAEERSKRFMALAEGILERISDSEPDEDTYEAQEKLAGTPQEHLYCLSGKVLIRMIADALDDLEYDGIIAFRAPSRAPVPTEKRTDALRGVEEVASDNPTAVGTKRAAAEPEGDPGTSERFSVPTEGATEPAPREEALIAAAQCADWTMVALNGGPPCFHYEEERGEFCLRAERWVGHDDVHEFVSLADLLRARAHTGEKADG